MPPPLPIDIIPNQSWRFNTNNTDAFDLDDYFFDSMNLTINYSFSLVPNITVVVDSSNLVSFYPDYGFMGTRNVTFYATNIFDNIFT